MLSTLAYYKLLKSLPDSGSVNGDLSSSTSPLVLLAAACSNIGKDGADEELCAQARQLLASSEFLKQQQILLESSIPNSHELLASHELLQSQELDNRKLQAIEQARDLTSSRALSELSRDLAQLRKEAEKTIDDINHDDPSTPSTTNITIDIESHIKHEPRSPSSPSSSKPSFRPPTRMSPKERSPRLSPSSTYNIRPDTSTSTPTSGTVHWGANNESGPPPNKVCPISIGSSSTLHPCDSSILSSLSMIPPSKGSTSIESRLHKYCLKQGAETSSSSSSTASGSTISLTSALSSNSTAWPAVKHEASYNTYRRSYNCYWLSPVGPCNRQFPGKDELYKHLRSHVNEIEALTPATAALQPLNPGCGSCDKNPRSFSNKPYSRYQPYSKCNQCTRCNCRK